MHTFTRLRAHAASIQNKDQQQSARTGGGIGRGVTAMTLKSSQRRVYLYAKRCCTGMIDKREGTDFTGNFTTQVIYKVICRTGFENRFKQYKRVL